MRKEQKGTGGWAKRAVTDGAVAREQIKLEIKLHFVLFLIDWKVSRALIDIAWVPFWDKWFDLSYMYRSVMLVMCSAGLSESVVRIVLYEFHLRHLETKTRRHCFGSNPDKCCDSSFQGTSCFRCWLIWLRSLFLLQVLTNLAEVFVFNRYWRVFVFHLLLNHSQYRFCNFLVACRL